jgi:DNA-binding NarL/FixJ family response regulator
VEQAERLRPEVILMDLRMPVMDGIQATEKIRLTNPEIPVVILSAYDDRSLELAAQNAGVFCYLLKGMRAGIIRDVLHQAVAGDTSKLGTPGVVLLPADQPEGTRPPPQSSRARLTPRDRASTTGAARRIAVSAGSSGDRAAAF